MSLMSASTYVCMYYCIVPAAPLARSCGRPTVCNVASDVCCVLRRLLWLVGGCEVWMVAVDGCCGWLLWMVAMDGVGVFIDLFISVCLFLFLFLTCDFLIR
ncbi:hypothetical protein BZA77DRAFT_314569 [Pyronema omphalodes]|nr:hypothetical protein BZA77DRAFT_314569 [Pyronema omphalodes]